MRLSGTTKKQTIVRAIAPTDIPAILRLIDSAWRVSLRLSPVALETRLLALPGVVALDAVGVRGFMALDPQPAGLAFITAAGLRDTWQPTPCFDLLLPRLEAAARAHHCTRLVYLGSAVWLIEQLQPRGFKPREWIITLERNQADLPASPPAVAALQPITRPYVPAVTALDALTFDDIWHTALGDLAEGLMKNDSFVLAVLEGHVVGYVWCEIFREQAHLTRLAVHPQFQGRGLGAQLLHRALADTMARGVTHISLNTQADNHRSLALDQRFGFIPTGQQMPLLVKGLE